MKFGFYGHLVSMVQKRLKRRGPALCSHEKVYLDWMPRPKVCKEDVVAAYELEALGVRTEAISVCHKEDGAWILLTD